MEPRLNSGSKNDEHSNLYGASVTGVRHIRARSSFHRYYIKICQLADSARRAETDTDRQRLEQSHGLAGRQTGR